ncbi:MAG: hypothetical protein QOJ50_436, partial [Cryptosporangiaceae bacterium]|nr:hypothetical protein [Cryptosporangiaceae bacterium]
AGSAEQVRPLLPGSAPALVIVTSRASLAGLAVSTGAARLSLDLLPTPDAEALLRSIVGAERADAEPGAIADLARLCARLPLALQLGGQRAAAYPDLPLAHLVAELASEPGRIAMLSSGADEATAVDAVFSWSYRNLPDPQARLFRLLGVHPGTDIGVPAAAALAGLPVSEARRLLHGLADARLAEPAAPDRFRMHDLLHAYARELAEADGLVTELPRLVGFYLHTAAAADRALHPARGPIPAGGAPEPAEPIAFAGYDEALRWCERELPVVVAVVRAAAEHGLTAAAWQLPNAMWSFFYLTKHRTEWTETHRIGLRAAEDAGDVAGRARLLNGLAAGSGIGEAEGLLRSASAGFRAVGDRRGEASALVNLGDAYLKAGRFAESVQHSAAALELVRGTGNPYVESAAVCNLGEAYLELGRPADAVTSFTEALELCRIGGNRVGEAVALVHLGEAYLELRRHDEAALHLGRGLAMCRDNGDRHGEARALVALGQVHHDTAAIAAARDCWEQAVGILAAMGDERAAGIRERLARLAVQPSGAERVRRPAAEPLTPAEDRIAALVASGLTNREVAEIARVSHKTVEVNLSRVYRKLGIRNRTELANRLQDAGA